MNSSAPPFTIGIEEEYLLVDKQTRALVADPPDSLMAECEERCGAQVTPEFLRSQIEIGTKVCNNIKEAEVELRRLRRIVIDVAANHGMAPIAASTHPFSRWSEQKQTEKDRYRALTVEMQAAARRLLICGMHVHVGINEDELRIDLMNQMSYFLPHLLALSCSSPFWEGRNTGLKSYRLTVFDSLPRTGLPERFSSYAEYERHINILMNAGLIEDATRIWWDLRPSARYPTLETRVMDVCTRLDDTISLAALLVCILRMLYRLRISNQRWRHVHTHAHSREPLARDALQLRRGTHRSWQGRGRSLRDPAGRNPLAGLGRRESARLHGGGGTHPQYPDARHQCSSPVKALRPRKSGR